MCGVLCQEVANFIKTRKEMTSDVGVPTIPKKGLYASSKVPLYLKLYNDIVVNNYYSLSMVTAGPLSAELSSEEYRLAMTLRDSTMFLKASLNQNTQKYDCPGQRTD